MKLHTHFLGDKSLICWKSDGISKKFVSENNSDS
jgi:hypothetical protein